MSSDGIGRNDPYSALEGSPESVQTGSWTVTRKVLDRARDGQSVSKCESGEMEEGLSRARDGRGQGNVELTLSFSPRVSERTIRPVSHCGSPYT